MSDAAKSPKKKTAAPKKPADHPPYFDMIKAAITALKERNGSSRQAIEKYIKANYKVGDSTGPPLKLALKKNAANGKLVHTKGVGASGSFKLSQAVKVDKPKKKVAAKKKPAAKPKKPAAKKVTKKPAAKKPAKKTAAKKPAVKKSPKKAASKKPVAKKAEKKPAAKKATSKKPAAKKSAKKPAKK